MKKRLIQSFVGALALVATLGVPAPVAANSDVERVKVKSTAAVAWTGSVNATTPHVRRVPECQNVGCDVVDIKVDLPRALERTPGGVHIKLRLVDALLDDSVGFVVYDQRRQVVAHAAAQIGPARSVILPNKDAHYVGYVYYNPMVPELGSSHLRYEAYARFEPTATYPGPVSDLLPDLEALPQRVVTFDSPFTFFDDVVSAQYPTCFQKSEVEERGYRLCLRLGQAMANVGRGPLDIRYSTPTGQRPASVPGYQRVYRSDGAYYELPSLGDMDYHPVHSHYHFHGFAISELWQVDASGNVIGTEPVASGQKNGFCAADTQIHWWDPNGPKAAVQSYPAPRCLDPLPRDPNLPDDGDEHFAHGIGEGWEDEYGWPLPDQSVEVSKVKDGTYALRTTVDPENLLKEEDDSNNCSQVLVTLTGLASGTPQASLVANSARSCPS